MISNGEDVVRVSRLMGHANAAITLNIYSHMIPREHDPSGDRLASLVFGNKMETVENPELTSNSDPAENTIKINELNGGQGGSRVKQIRLSSEADFLSLKI